MKGEKIRITQVRSIIKTTQGQKAAIRALGLGRPSYFVEVEDEPRLRGQIRKVAHLVNVEVVQ